MLTLAQMKFCLTVRCQKDTLFFPDYLSANSQNYKGCFFINTWGHVLVMTKDFGYFLTSSVF